MYHLQQQHGFKSQCDKLRMDLRPSVQQQNEWLYITTDPFHRNAHTEGFIRLNVLIVTTERFVQSSRVKNRSISYDD